MNSQHNDKSQLRISVIVVVRNGEAYLAQALQSIMDQDYRPIEVIVVDGQSTDQTAEIARSFNHVQYLWQNTLGLANARNQGIATARGDFIAFLDHDDVWAPNKLSAQISYLGNHRAILFTISYIQFFAEQNILLRPGFKRESFEVGQIGSTPSALLARRAVFDYLGGFDPNFTIGCDADWFARARDKAIPMKVIPQILLYKRIHNTNLSTDTRTNKQELMAVIRQSILRKNGLKRK